MAFFYSEKTMNRWISLVETLNNAIGRAVSWLSLLMVLTTFLVVVLRYVFDSGWIALQESVIYMHSLVFMLAAAYTLNHEGHVRVDIFYQRMSVKKRAWVDCLGALFLLLPVSIFILWSSWHYVTESWSVLEGSRHSGGLPGLFLLKSLIIVMALQLALQAVAMFFKNLSLALSSQNRESA
jgi:TRAP-type mannitol/chloroaromatic compound transport system permease small subunit